MIRFECTSCGKRLKAPEETIGKHATCPRCGTGTVVPNTQDQFEPPVSPPVEHHEVQFDPYHRWLGIPPSEQPANHYRLLGISPFESDPEVIRDAAAQRMAHVRTYQLGPNCALSQKILNELGEAKACLLDPDDKAAYDAQLLAAIESQPSSVETPSGIAPDLWLPIKQALPVPAPPPTASPIPLTSKRSLWASGKFLVLAAAGVCVVVWPVP